MQSGKLKILIFLLFLFSSPAYADGGIPLWVLTTSSMLGASFLTMPDFFAETIFCILLTIFMLIIVVCVETFIIHNFYLMDFQYKELFKIVLKANIISTLIGTIIIVLPIPIVYKYNPIGSDNIGLGMVIMGPWGMLNPILLFVSTLLLFWMSYLIEVAFVKKDLVEYYDIEIVKKAFLRANFVSYSMPLLLYLFLAICTLLYN